MLQHPKIARRMPESVGPLRAGDVGIENENRRAWMREFGRQVAGGRVETAGAKLKCFGRKSFAWTAEEPRPQVVDGGDVAPGKNGHSQLANSSFITPNLLTIYLQWHLRS